MKLFDTNVVVAAIITKREFHERSYRAFLSSKQKSEACIGAHSLAEIYNTLSGRMKIPPLEAKKLMELNLQDIEVVNLGDSEYSAAIARVSNLGISGGVVFDALLAECAVKRECDTLYTFNLTHFTRLGADIKAIAREP